MKLKASIAMYLPRVLLLQLASSWFLHINAERSEIDSCLSYDFGDLEKYVEGVNFSKAAMMKPLILENERIAADLPFGRLPIDWKRLSRLGDVLPMDVEFKKKFVVAYKILIIAHELSLDSGSEEFSGLETIGRGEEAGTGSWESEESGSVDKKKSRPEDRLDTVLQNATSPVASTTLESIPASEESGQNLLFTNVSSSVSPEVQTTGLSNVERTYNQPWTTTHRKYTETPLVSSPSSPQNTINSVDPETPNFTLKLFTTTRRSVASRADDVESSSLDYSHVSTTEQSSLSKTGVTRHESATIKPHHRRYYTSTQQSLPSGTKFPASSSSSFRNDDFHEEYEGVTADGASGRVGKSTDAFQATSRSGTLFPKVSRELVKTTSSYLPREEYASRNVTATPSKTVHELSSQSHVTRGDFGVTVKTMFENNFTNFSSEMSAGNDEASTFLSRERYTTNFQAGGPFAGSATSDSGFTDMVTGVLVSLKPTGQTTMTSDSPATSERREDVESVFTTGIARDTVGSGGTTSRKLYTTSFESFRTSGDVEEDLAYEDNAPTSGFINANGSLPRLSTVVIKDDTTITSQGMVEDRVGGRISENSTASMENGSATRTPLARDESRDVARWNDTSSYVTSSQTVFTDSSVSSVEDQLMTSVEQQAVDLSVAVTVRASTLVGYHDDVDDGRNTPTTKQTEQDTTNVSSYPLTNDSIATIVRLQTTTILDSLGATIHTPRKVVAETSSPASEIVTTSSSIDSTKLDTKMESREVFNGLTTFSRPPLTNTVSEVTAEANDTLWTTAGWKILMESTTKLPFVVTTTISSTSNTSKKLDEDLGNGAENISRKHHSTIPDINNSANTDATSFTIVEGNANVQSLKTQKPVENIPDKEILTFNVAKDVQGQAEIFEHQPAMEIGSNGKHSTASTPAIGHIIKIHSRNKWNSFGDDSSTSNHLEIPKKTDHVFQYEDSNWPIFVPLIPKFDEKFPPNSNRLPSEWNIQKRAKSNMDVEKLYRWFYRHNEDLGESYRRGPGIVSKTAAIRCKN